MLYNNFSQTKSSKKREKGNSLLEITDNYVLIDLETTGLDPTWDEIIEVAAIKVEDNAIIDKYSSLVKPNQEIDDFITDLTGITNEMVANAPSIESVLPKLLSFVGDSIVIGHNVNFDINFIYDNCVVILNQHFSNDFIDTMRLSRRLFPQERHHRLKDLTKRYNIINENSHRAMSDVIATKQCYDYLYNYITENNIQLSELLKRKYHSHPHPGLKAKDIIATTDDFDETSLIYQNVFVFTGTLEQMTRREAMQEVVNRGGVCGDNVTKKTNYLVLGNNDYCKTIKDGKSNKQKKAEQLKIAGNDIEIISEDVFLDML